MKTDEYIRLQHKWIQFLEANPDDNLDRYLDFQREAIYQSSTDSELTSQKNFNKKFGRTGPLSNMTNGISQEDSTKVSDALVSIRERYLYFKKEAEKASFNKEEEQKAANLKCWVVDRLMAAPSSIQGMMTQRRKNRWINNAEFYQPKTFYYSKETKKVYPVKSPEKRFVEAMKEMSSNIWSVFLDGIETELLSVMERKAAFALAVDVAASEKLTRDDIGVLDAVGSYLKIPKKDRQKYISAGLAQ
jgi:hypothetical protein